MQEEEVKNKKDCKNCFLQWECDLQNIPEFEGDEICIKSTETDEHNSL